MFSLRCTLGFAVCVFGLDLIKNDIVYDDDMGRAKYHLRVIVVESEDEVVVLDLMEFKQGKANRIPKNAQVAIIYEANPNYYDIR